MQILSRPVRYLAIRSLVKHALFLVVIWIAMGMTVAPQNIVSREYQVKAVFLYNFSQFVEWPQNAFSHQDDPLIIGILGENPFDDYLEQTVKGERVNGHFLEVRHFQHLNQITDCHILFINLSDKEQLKNVMGALASRNILTVGESTNFAKQGGIVRFFAEENRTRIRINLDAAKKAGLTISSKLLKVADVVNSQTD